jgi:type III restriction enzyme
VPFTFLPHEEAGDGPPPTPTPKTRVEPLREREAEFEIAWPNIIRIEHVYSPALTLDLARVERLQLNAVDTATYAELAAVLEGKPHIAEMTDIDLQELAQRFRMQRIVFEVTRDLFDQMKPGWHGNKEVLLAQLIRLVERVLASDRIVIEPAQFNQDDLRRRLILTMHINKIVQHIWEAIRFENTERLEPVFDTARPIMSTADMRPWFTGRPCENTRRSHINVCVYDSRWEASESFVLDRRDQRHVAAWAKNDHLGFEVMYVFGGIVRKYRPDFLIRLTNGTMLVLEVKGENTPRDDTKRRFLAEWVRAVNADGGFGRWANDVSFNTADIHGILEKHDAVA